MKSLTNAVVNPRLSQCWSSRCTAALLICLLALGAAPLFAQPLVVYRGSDIDMEDRQFLQELTQCAAFHLLNGVMTIDDSQLEQLAGVIDEFAGDGDKEQIRELLEDFDQYMQSSLSREEKAIIQGSFKAGAEYLDLAIEYYPQEEVGEAFASQLVAMIQQQDHGSHDIETMCRKWQRPRRLRFRKR